MSDTKRRTGPKPSGRPWRVRMSLRLDAVAEAVLERHRPKGSGMTKGAFLASILERYARELEPDAFKDGSP